MSIDRRTLLTVLSAAVPCALLTARVDAARTDEPMPSGTFPFEKLPVNASNGAQFRPVLKGKLATGESLETHETTLPPGGAPHPPHRHVHSEMWLIREGTVELNINGERHRLGPGAVGFVRSNEEHGISNVGDKPATYFVVAVGPGAA
jgi:quercetin dioxygenase-like cupin family protein